MVWGSGVGVEGVLFRVGGLGGHLLELLGVLALAVQRLDPAQNLA